MDNNNNTQKQLKQFSTFTGVGGMDIGGFVNDFVSVYACDLHKASRKFFENNFPDVPFDQTDVRNLHLDRINEIRQKSGQAPIAPGEIDVFTAGSPCVKLSACNTTDARDFAAENLLMVETLPMLVRELRPKIVWFENSDRLCSKKRNPLRMEYESSLKSLLPDYTYQMKVLNAMRYGAFQSRSRTMTVMVNNDVLKGRKISFFPDPSKVDLSVQGAHYLLPWVKSFWAGQFEEKYRPAVGNLFCTLTASGGEMVKDYADQVHRLSNEDRKKLTGMEEYNYDGICQTHVTMLLGNIVMRQLAERMFAHFRSVILKQDVI